MLQILHHGSRWQSLQLLHSEGHIFYSVSFTYKGERARLGEGQREEINSIHPGNCSCYYKWPRRAHYKLPCEAVSLECPSRGVSQPPARAPRSTSTTLLSRAARRGRAGTRGPGWGSFHESPGAGARGSSGPGSQPPHTPAARLSSGDSSPPPPAPPPAPALGAPRLARPRLAGPQPVAKPGRRKGPFMDLCVF